LKNCFNLCCLAIFLHKKKPAVLSDKRAETGRGGLGGEGSEASCRLREILPELR